MPEATPTRPTIHLLSQGDYKPAVVIGTDGPSLPPDVGGVPAFYYWKEAVRPGEYAGGGFDDKGNIIPETVSFTDQRIKKLCNSGNAKLAAGLKIPINREHGGESDDSLGFVKLWKVDTVKDDPSGYEGPALFSLTQFIGETARDEAMRNQVSIGVDEDYTDPTGKKWGDSPIHLAVTQCPASAIQSDYIQAASASTDAARGVLFLKTASAPTNRSNPMDMPEEQLSALRAQPHLAMGKDAVTDSKVPQHLADFHKRHSEHLSAMCSHLPGGDSIPHTEAMPRAIQHMETMKQIGGRLGISHLSADSKVQLLAKVDEMASAAKRADATKSELDEANNQIKLLSARVIKPVDEDQAAMIMDSVETVRDAAVASGGIDPATASALMSEFGRGADGKINVLMCSKHASNSGASVPLIRLFKLLTNNKVTPKTGERTGVQTLRRAVPEVREPVDAKELEETRKHMVEMASNR